MALKENPSTFMGGAYVRHMVEASRRGAEYPFSGDANLLNETIRKRNKWALQGGPKDGQVVNLAGHASLVVKVINPEPSREPAVNTPLPLASDLVKIITYSPQQLKDGRWVLVAGEPS